MKCAECKYAGNCKEKAKEPKLIGCTSGIPVEKMGIRTNAERIRAMTNAELADFLCKVKSDYQWADHEFPSEDACGDWDEWLESEVENG